MGFFWGWDIKSSFEVSLYSWTTTWVDRRTVFEPYPNSKNSPLEPKRVKNDPKYKSKSNVRIKENIGNESCSTRWVDPKTVVEPYSDPKPAH